MKLTKKTSEILSFVQVSTQMLSNPEVLKSKFAHSLKKQSKILMTSVYQYDEKIEDLRIEHCSVDEKKNILRDAAGKFVFTKEGERAFNSGAKKIMEAPIEFEYFLNLDEAPKDLPEHYIHFLTDFVTQSETE